MKKIAIIATAVMMLFAFTACASPAKEPDISVMMDKFMTELDLPDMAEVTKENLETQISISGDNFETVSCYVAGSGMATDEIIVGKIADEVKAEDVVAAIEGRKNMQYDLFEPYAPDEAAKVEGSVIHTMKVGDTEYVLFAVCNDSAKAKKIFTDSF